MAVMLRIATEETGTLVVAATPETMYPLSEAARKTGADADGGGEGEGAAFDRSPTPRLTPRLRAKSTAAAKATSTQRCEERGRRLLGQAGQSLTASAGLPSSSAWMGAHLGRLVAELLRRLAEARLHEVVEVNHERQVFKGGREFFGPHKLKDVSFLQSKFGLL